MPKRKHSEDFELEFLRWKNKKLERELNRKRSRKHKRRDRSRSRSALRTQDRSRSSSRDSRHTDTAAPANDADDGENAHASNLHNIFGEAENVPENPEVSPEIVVDNHSVQNIEADASVGTNVEAEPSTAANENTFIEEPTPEGIDTELLEILGVDPSATVEYGKEIHPELASRLQHIATAGLTKEARKELNDRYLIPANSVKIGAPSMNPEIKAAVTETVTKRDKGIEARQKQLAAAISGLAVVLNSELEAKNKDSGHSKQLMDICRILCDIQHAESIIRRNFAIFSIKKELKEHLVNTKIDKCLFGENLSETLKSAKAVTKSGTELKTKPPPKPKPPTPVGNLNWKSPAPARKPPQGAGRGREAAPPPAPGPVARFTRNTPHAGSSKTSYHQYRQNRRR